MEAGAGVDYPAAGHTLLDRAISRQSVQQARPHFPSDARLRYKGDMTDNRRELPRAAEFYSLDGNHIQDENAFTEIANAILRLNFAFKRVGLSAPKSIELGSHEDGFLLRHILPSSMVVAYPSQALRGEDDTDVIFPICGVEMRYPAKFRRERKSRTEIL